MKVTLRRVSLLTRGSKLQFEIAAVLITILPALVIAYLVSSGAVVRGGLTTTEWVVAALVAVLICLGYGLLRKYPRTISRMRQYLEDMARGQIPDKVALIESESDIRAIEKVLNVLVDAMRQHVDMVERERNLLEKQLYQAHKLEMIGTLAAGIAHEINTPVQFVGDNTRFLTEALRDMQRLLGAYRNVLTEVSQLIDGSKVDPVRRVETEVDVKYLEEEIPKALSQSLEGLERVAKIVQAMRDFSFFGGAAERALTDINTAVETTVTVSRNEWKYVADVETTLSQDLPLVPCYAGEVKQVLLNLIVNAAQAIKGKYPDGGQKGRIGIATRRNDGWVEIAVSDDGTGIPSDVRGKIFEPFFTTKKRGEGTGQGLAISKSSIVKHHGGEMFFETEEGKGTTFVVRLPLRTGTSSGSEAA